MGFPPARFLALLLAIAALVAGSACSIRESKISNSDIDKLNSANAKIGGMSSEYRQGIAKCASAAERSACENRLFLKLAGDEQSAGDTYEQVARHVHGDCQSAIKAQAASYHAAAAALRQMKTPPTTYAQMKARSDEVKRACKLTSASK
jgi:septal ring factor EnvC (AmiA/AmiB activator)